MHKKAIENKEYVWHELPYGPLDTIYKSVSQSLIYIGLAFEDFKSISSRLFPDEFDVLSYFNEFDTERLLVKSLMHDSIKTNSGIDFEPDLFFIFADEHRKNALITELANSVLDEDCQGSKNIATLLTIFEKLKLDDAFDFHIKQCMTILDNGGIESRSLSKKIASIGLERKMLLNTENLSSDDMHEIEDFSKQINQVVSL